jgi:hypothetical protein
VSIIRVYNGKGLLQHRAVGAKADLMEEGARLTRTKGQWTCDLLLVSGGKKVATCKRGVWTEVKP